MKRIRSSVCLLLTVVMMLSLSITAFAAGDVTVNGEAVKSGDTVTYAYYLSGVKDPLEGAGAYITYDNTALEYVDGSIGFDVLSNAMYNMEPGKIYYSAIDVINGFDVSEEKMMVTLSFKVLDGAKGDLLIEHKYDEIFTLVNEEVDLKEDEYTGRAETTVNTYTENDAPFKGVDANRLEEYEKSSETDFDNMMLGTDKEELVASAAATSEKTDITASDGSSSESTAETSSGTLSSESAENKGSSSTIVVIIVIVFIVLLVGAVVFAILSGKKSK